VPHWLHLGWISSTAGAAVKGDLNPVVFFWGWKKDGKLAGFHHSTWDFTSKTPIF
jgi:hypothetical protein